jgi:hypothetical protein
MKDILAPLWQTEIVTTPDRFRLCPILTPLSRIIIAAFRITDIHSWYFWVAQLVEMG